MLVAKVHSLQSLPHYTLQLSLGHPAEDRRQRNIDCCERNKTQTYFLIYYSSRFKKRSGALRGPLVTRVTLGPSLTATAPLFSGAARVSAARPCGKRKNGQTRWPGLVLCDFTWHKLTLSSDLVTVDCERSAQSAGRKEKHWSDILDFRLGDSSRALLPTFYVFEISWQQSWLPLCNSPGSFQPPFSVQQHS